MVVPFSGDLVGLAVVVGVVFTDEYQPTAAAQHLGPPADRQPRVRQREQHRSAGNQVESPRTQVGLRGFDVALVQVDRQPRSPAAAAHVANMVGEKSSPLVRHPSSAQSCDTVPGPVPMSRASPVGMPSVALFSAAFQAFRAAGSGNSPSIVPRAQPRTRPG